MKVRPQQPASDASISGKATPEAGKKKRKRPDSSGGETSSGLVGYRQGDDVMIKDKKQNVGNQLPSFVHMRAVASAQSSKLDGISSWSQLTFQSETDEKVIAIKKAKAFSERLPYIVAGKLQGSTAVFSDGSSIANEVFSKMPYPGIKDRDPKAWDRDINSYVFFCLPSEKSPLRRVGTIQELLDGGMLTTMVKSMLLINDTSMWQGISSYYAKGEEKKGRYLYAWLFQKGHILMQDKKSSAEIMKSLSKDDVKQAQADLLVECSSKDATALLTMLLEDGADPNVRSERFSRSPLVLAQECKKKQNAAVLIEHGAIGWEDDSDDFDD